MNKEQLNEKLINALCKEFQSVWLINLSDLSLKMFASESDAHILEGIRLVSAMKNYDEARNYYIDNFVVEHSRPRMVEETKIDNVLKKTAGGDSFFVEYGRVVGDLTNYNQLRFDRIFDEDGKTEYLLMGFRDIDVRMKAEIDDLTGLLTRQAFFDKAEELLIDCPDEQFDIIISDIVDFKKVNETYGAKIADEILSWEGNYIASHRSDGMLCGRYGGDQMAVFGTHTSIMRWMADSFHEHFMEELKNNGLPDIVIKFGAYLDIRHDQSVISSCDKAHMALNSIKRHYVKDIAFYDDKLKSQIDKQRRIEDSMYDSLKNGDFKVFYQPKHDAKTGELVGAEALIRWIHPEYGFMSPADFVPMFEQNGFIFENDKYVWRKTCENLRKWEERGIKTVPISVNLSKLTMSNISLEDDMQWPVVRNGISPDKLHIEITETLMTADVEELIAKLNSIREAGFMIELDDFGAGYSSINILSTLPIDVVKLDMSFMKQFGDVKRSKVLAACVNLAKELGFKTVSEGVELKEQMEVLGNLGVDAIQGYYYSRPLPEEDFEKYLTKYGV